MKPLQNFIRQVTKYGFEPLFKRYYSRYPARVVDNKDKEESGLQQLNLHIPLLHQRGTSQWVKGYGVPAGNNYGLQSLPQIGDYVYVTFEHGDARRPRWDYGWYAKDEKPEEFTDENVHGFKSPAGHSVLIDDTNHEIRVTMKDGKTFMINQQVLELNGNNLGGLIDIEELKTELQKINDQLSAIKQVVSAPIPEPGNGSPSALAVALNSSLSPLTNPTYTNIENDKVKHGNN
tara:strand:- start:4150 stop:4848 length:699 start_codon:yes stop_codon:yes gene_type:complete